MRELEQLLRERTPVWKAHPTVMVRELFHVEPDTWQEEALESFPHSPRLCFKSCTGPGKTAVLAWLGWNFLLTRPHCQCGATSVSGDNLKTGLWTELARWRAACPLLQHLFEQTKTTIFLRSHPNTWKLEARTWPKDADPSQIGNALRGMHAKNILWLADESGDYPDSIMPVLEAIFSGDPTEAHIVQAGNPLKRSGPLYRACYQARNLWKVIEITADPDDPKRTPRVSKEHARQQIEQWGADNPWVMVNIFGRFPPSDINALISEDEVRAAMKRYHRSDEIGNAPKVLGVDVAREGNDKSVICPRQGIQCFPMKIYRNIDSNQGAGQVARMWNDWNADAAFIDMTGGWGTGWFDGLVRLGKAPIGVYFSGEAHQKARYYNKRAEMYFETVEWIKRGGALPLVEGTAPELSELFLALTQITYSFRGDRFLLEDKAQFKDRTGFSPDEADALVETFAEPIAARTQLSPRAPARSAVADYNPFPSFDRDTNQRTSVGNYDPFGGLQ